MSMTWNGDAVRKKIESEIGKRLDASAIVLVNHTRRLIGVEGTAKIGKGKGAKLIYGAFPSAVGEPPHKQTGRLQSSIAWERDHLVARVGTNVKYGFFLQYGLGQRGPRPWLDRALREKTPEIQRIVSRPIV
jgi:hypothetical protein